MRLVKSQNIGFIQRAYGHGKTFYYVASPIVFFDLNSNQILAENQQWAKVASALQGDALDQGLPKTCGEFLLAGHAYPDEGESAVIYPSIAIAGKQKQLKVLGKREWKFSLLRGTCPNEPDTLREPVALNWQNTYGGEDYSYNPFGTGYNKKTQPPQVEKEGYGTEYPGKKTPAMSFLPIPMTWPQRAKYQGKYKKDWFEKYFPAFSPSTDLQLFNSVGKDQHIDGYFQGNESYRLTHLHPDNKEFEGRLPGVTTRVFVNYLQEFIELPVDLDTVWFMPSVGLGALVFRAQVPVATTEFLEISDLVIGYENAADEPKTLAHYQEVFTLRTDKDTALENVMNESQLAPSPSPQQQADKQAQIAQQRQTKIRELKAYQQKMLKHFAPELAAGATLPEPELTPADDILEQDLKSGNLDLGPLLKHAAEKTAQAQQQGDERIAELYEKFPQAKATQLEDVSIDTAQIEKNIETCHLKGSTEQQALLSQQLTIKPEQSLAIASEDQLRLREFAKAYIATTGQLSCNNLTGADLSLLTFENTDFSEVVLSFANLQNCIFENCNFSSASLVNAQLSGTVFINCELDSAQLSGATGTNVCFQTCNLSNLLWRHTKLIQAKFENCTLVSATLLHSDLVRAKFINTALEQSTITQCKFTDSDFTDCQLSQNIYSQCNLQMTRWQGCVFNRTAIQLSFMQLARFQQVTTHKLVFSTDMDIRCCSWFDCQLELSSFRSVPAVRMRMFNCQLSNCDLSHARLDFSQFSHAKLFRTLFTEGVLRGAQLQHCNLYKSRFRAAQLANTELQNCNLLETDFMWAQIPNTRFTDCKNYSKLMTRDLARRSTQQEVSDEQIRITGTA